MLAKIVVLLLIELNAVHACGPKIKFCVPRKALRCAECVDPDDKCCEVTTTVYCDDDAVQRTYAQYGGNVTDSKAYPLPYLDGKYEYVCVYNYILNERDNETEFYRNVRGCERGIGHSHTANEGDHLITDMCRCARDNCNAYDKQPFSETGEPNKFYSRPYNYQEKDENDVYLYCPRPTKQP